MKTTNDPMPLSIFDLFSLDDALTFDEQPLEEPAKRADYALKPFAGNPWQPMPVTPITHNIERYTLQLSQRYETGYQIFGIIERCMALMSFKPDAQWILANVHDLDYYLKNKIIEPNEPVILHALVKDDQKHLARPYEISPRALYALYDARR